MCVFLGFVPILCAGAGYGLVKLQNRRRRRLKILQEAIQRRSGGRICVDKMIVREWLHANHRRLVTVKFGPEAALHIVDRKGEKLRTFDFSDVNTIAMEESQVNPVCLATTIEKAQVTSRSRLFATKLYFASASREIIRREQAGSCARARALRVSSRK